MSEQISEHIIDLTWMGLVRALVNLDLIESDLSVDPLHYLNYKVKYIPSYLPWIVPYDDLEEEEKDEDQLDALHSMRSIEVKFYAVKSFWRIHGR